MIHLGKDNVKWVDAARNPELLSYAGLRKFGHNCKGTTDLMVAKRSAVKAHHLEKGTRMLFDFRTKVTDADLMHAEVRALLANLHAPAEKPVVVRSIHHQDCLP